MIGPSGGGGFPIPGWVLLLLLSAVVFAGLVKMVWGRHRSGLPLLDRRVALAALAVLGLLVWYRVESEPRWHIRAVAGDVESIVESAGIDFARSGVEGDVRTICNDRRIVRQPAVRFGGTFAVESGNVDYRVELERIAVAFEDDGWETFRFENAVDEASLIARRGRDVARFIVTLPGSYTGSVRAADCAFEAAYTSSVSSFFMTEVESFIE